MNILTIRESEWDKDGTIVKVSHVTLEDGREVPGYDLPPGLEEGKPLPEGWEIATSARGKPYLKAPKPNRGGGGFGGGAAAFRNTKEGQAAEQRSIHASVALGHAITLRPNGTTADITKVADELLVWLSKASGHPLPAGTGGASNWGAPPSPSPVREGSGAAQNRTSGEGATASPATEQGESLGKDIPAPSGVCAHIDNSPLKPDGAALPKGFVRCLGCGVVHKEAKP